MLPMLIVMLVVAEAAAPVAVMLPMFMVEVPISILKMEELFAT